MAMCPAYCGSDLLAVLLARVALPRCVQAPGARLCAQVESFLKNRLSAPLSARLNSTRAGASSACWLLMNLAFGLLLLFIYSQSRGRLPIERDAVSTTLWLVFFSLLVLSGVVSWVIVLAFENRRERRGRDGSPDERCCSRKSRRTSAPTRRCSRRRKRPNPPTSRRSRYIVGLIHEIRTPLNSIYGYAQLLERARVRTVRAMRCASSAAAPST